MLTKVRKRDGRVVNFEVARIEDAIFKAAQSLGGSNRERAKTLAEKVVGLLEKKFDSEIPSVEDVQDAVEKVLVEAGHAATAKAYILYRQKHSELREARKAVLGKESDLKLSLNALTVLRERYLLKNDAGEVIETPDELFWRVARNVAEVDALYDPRADVEETTAIFHDLMARLDFLPNSPTLMNAGAPLQQLQACFVLPVDDSMESIFDTLKHAALIQQTGGGTGFAFSRLRPKGDIVKSTQGVASGPVSFLRVYDAATEAIKQGGRRRGANMAILRVDHPDIVEFITLKSDGKAVPNFNISVAITPEFWKALEKNEDYELVNPRTQKPEGKLNARYVFDLLVGIAWKTGDPGVVFLERMNDERTNPTPALGQIESTNPCAESPLLPYEACVLGSVNVANFYKNEEVDWERLKSVVHNAVHFLDNVIDASCYPLPEIEEITRNGNRKIGLGVMGFANLLCLLRIPYDSEEALAFAEKLMKFVGEEADSASAVLAEKRGPFPFWEKSLYAGGKKLRNATRTTIAPTGTLSMIADCSGGIEPLFALTYNKRVLEGKELVYVNKHFEAQVKHLPELMKKISETGSCQGLKEVPEDVRRVFITAYDIAPEWHVRMQAAFQKYTDNAVSKTVNFPANATAKDVETVFRLAWEFGCKGVTVYRDTSKAQQVLAVKRRVAEEEKEVSAEPVQVGKCPRCGEDMDEFHDQATCVVCGVCV